jgi:hypothetical protein
MIMINKAFFMRRLNDHIQYLKQIDAAVNGKSDFQGTTYRDCQLGQWLYQEAPTVIANMKNTKAQEVYESLLEPHKRFHLLGEEALQKKQAGDEVGAKSALTQLHLLSNLLTKKLLELDSIS